MVQELIRTLTLLKGLNQKEMAERLNKSVSAYNWMESGETVISSEELFEMTQILACSMDELSEGDNCGYTSETKRSAGCGDTTRY